MRTDRFQSVRIFFICSVSLLLFIECNSLNPASPGPQPRFLEEAEHQILLNVLGILRPDSLDGMTNSFVHLEVSYLVNDDRGNNIVTDAGVQVFQIEGTEVVDSVAFTYSDLGVFLAQEYRHPTFKPQPGTYRLVCRQEGIPELSAQTTMPGRPVIREGTMRRDGDTLLFSIIRDEEVGLYEIVLNGQGWQKQARFLRPESGDVVIAFSLDGVQANGCELTIFAFDLNLSEYLTYNLSIKPHIYQNDISMVDNGYGCFGSLNIYRQNIDF